MYALPAAAHVFQPRRKLFTTVPNEYIRMFYAPATVTYGCQVTYSYQLLAQLHELHDVLQMAGPIGNEKPDVGGYTYAGLNRSLHSSISRIYSRKGGP